MSEKDPLNWKRMSFKGNKVWAAVDDKGDFCLEKGKVLIKYNLAQDYEYRILPDSLKSDANENLVQKGLKKASPAPKKAAAAPPPQDCSHSEEGIIHVFTDGASSGNPGPSGIGVFFRFGGHEREISRNIGQATNNIAELEAIRVALSEIKNPQLPVRIYTDSSYALGLLSRNFKAKKNQELVESIRTLMKQFPDLSFIKVQGHAGVEGNERADQLATSAIKKY